MGLGTIKCPAGGQKGRAVDAGLVVAPHDMAVALVEPDVETSLRRRILDDRRVVAVDGVVVVRVQAAQDRLRILFIEIAEQ